MDNNDFKNLGYQVVRGIINPANYLNYLKLILERGEGITKPKEKGTVHFPKAFMFEKLLVSLCPEIQAYCDYEIRPTYSFARVYKTGSKLTRHTDRDGCEVSITICLGYDQDVWPIYISDREKKEQSVLLEPGDGLLFLGQELEHWRMKNNTGTAYQVFLHYVNINSTYIEPPLAKIIY